MKLDIEVDQLMLAKRARSHALRTVEEAMRGTGAAITDETRDMVTAGITGAFVIAYNAALSDVVQTLERLPPPRPSGSALRGAQLGRLNRPKRRR